MVNLMASKQSMPNHYDRTHSKTDLGQQLHSSHKRAEPINSTDGSKISDNESSGIELYSAIPLSEPVASDLMMDGIVGSLRRFCKLSAEEDYDAVALWIVFTYVWRRFPLSPRLLISAPEKRCGKSTLLNVIAMIADRVLRADGITAAVIFRVVQSDQPCLLLDEADTFLRRENEDLRGVINSGYSRSGMIYRCVGDGHKVRGFATWSPVAVAMIGKPPGTITDRSIRISMRRKLANETTEPFRLDLPEQFEQLRRQLARWTIDNGANLSCVDPTFDRIPNDRAMDNWRPLIAISDVLGGDWPARARKAFRSLGAQEDSLSTGEELLNDIRNLLSEYKDPHIKTTELIEKLTDDKELKWATINNGKPITPHRFSILLKKYKLSRREFRSSTYRGMKIRGFHIADFEDAFKRYLPVNPKNEDD